LIVLGVNLKELKVEESIRIELNNSETKDCFVNGDKIQGSNCNWSRGKIENSHVYSWKRRRFGITVHRLLPHTRDRFSRKMRQNGYIHGPRLLPSLPAAQYHTMHLQMKVGRYHCRTVSSHRAGRPWSLSWGQTECTLWPYKGQRKARQGGGGRRAQRERPRNQESHKTEDDTEIQREERPEKKKTKEKADRTEREGENPESRRKQEIKRKKGEDVAQPGRHQRLHLRSSSYRSVAFFFPRFSFLITLALLPACVSNSRTHARQ